MVLIKLVGRAECAHRAPLPTAFEPRDHSLELIARNTIGQRHPPIAVADHDQEVGWRVILGSVNFAEADMRRALVELRFLADTPSEIKGQELVAFGRAIAIEGREHLALQQLPLLSE